jgi:hypothetical protein
MKHEEFQKENQWTITYLGYKYTLGLTKQQFLQKIRVVLVMS